MLLFYDTETSGFFHSGPDHDPSQPHMLELAALLTDDDGEHRAAMAALIKGPPGMEIGEEAQKAHGITIELLEAAGLDLPDVLFTFCTMLHRADKIIGHNIDFDIRILKIALARAFGGPLPPDNRHIVALDKKPRFCTMKAAADVCRIPNQYNSGWKNPKLHEAYRFFTGKEHVGAHRALADVEACVPIYLGIMRHRGMLPVSTVPKAAARPAAAPPPPAPNKEEPKEAVYL